ncbi:MAG TPA: class I SAM-dependent methyltransferase, partial [Thermoanaerobaculia bacterium]
MPEPALTLPPQSEVQPPIAGGATPLVSRLLAIAGTSPRLHLEIDPHDEMLAFLLASHDGDRERALYTYFRSGWSIADALGQVLAWRFGGAAKVGRLLDFASGCGRVTRFLLEAVPAERVWVSDVLPGAVEFQRRQLGVHAFPSTVQPEDFRSPERFDAILVTSL